MSGMRRRPYGTRVGRVDAELCSTGLLAGTLDAGMLRALSDDTASSCASRRAALEEPVGLDRCFDPRDPFGDNKLGTSIADAARWPPSRSNKAIGLVVGAATLPF